MPFKLYIIYYAKLDKFYIWHTGDDLFERLRKHNSNHRGFTGKSPDWVMVYIEKYATKNEAYKREREIKGSKSRNLIVSLIGSVHPDL